MNRLTKLLEELRGVIGVLTLSARIEPRYLPLAVPQALLAAAVPVMAVYLTRAVLDALTTGQTYTSLLRVIAAYAIVLLLIRLLAGWLQNRLGLLGEAFPQRFRQQVGVLTMSLRLEHTESQRARTMLALAGNTAQVTQVQIIIQGIITQIITIITLSAIIIRLDWICVLLVTVTLAVKIWFTASNNRYLFKHRARLAQNDRADMSLYNARNSEGGAKELRVNGLQAWMTEKIRVFRQEMLDIQYGAFRHIAFADCMVALATALQMLCILGILIYRYTQDIISIGEFSMYFAAVTTLTASLSAVTEHVGQYNEMMINVADYSALQELQPAASHVVPQPSLTTTDAAEIVFDHVSFTYPNSDQEALSDVTLTIHNREKLMLVGPNGAGKSTFIKLLCKFYKPTTGCITYNGINIWDIPTEMYYAAIAAVFQDFANFAFTLRENIVLGNVVRGEQYLYSLQRAGLSAFVAGLPHQSDTYLSRSFDSEGMELSGGERQKVAIARALYKNAPLLILDEPTASLDPLAESDIYQRFFNMAERKTTVYVSHRLAASLLADHIAVFEGGQIKAYGSHAELIQQNELYAHMYQAQSWAYKEDLSLQAKK